jgi:hypothetical protein
MNVHRRGKVTVRERRDDVAQMRANCRYVLGILAVIRGYFDSSAVRVQAKMVAKIQMILSRRELLSLRL